jgi:L-2,4-diaminobutyrate decarboxylase
MTARTPDFVEPFKVSSLGALEHRLLPFARLALATLADSNLRTGPSALAQDLARHFAGDLPALGESPWHLAERLAHTVIPFGRNKRSPCYFAQMDVPPADLSVFAGLIIRAIAQDPIAFCSSRSGTFVERQLTRWLAALIYEQSATAGGVVTTGGSQSNLQALLLLRNYAFARRGIDVSALGLAASLERLGGGGLLLLASERAHESIFSAARFIGLGDGTVGKVAVEDCEEIDLVDLHDRLACAQMRQQTVMAVVLTACTTGSGTIDPLRRAAALAQEYGVPVHVDAAHGGMLLFSPKYAQLLDGIDAATTVTLDPHKILGVNQSLGFLAVRDVSLLDCLGKVGIDYYPPGAEPDLGRWSMDNSRCLESLSGWLMLRALGRDGYAQIVDHLMELAATFCAELMAHGGFELLRPPAANVIAFRSCAQPEESPRAQNLRNEAILSRILNDETFSLSWYSASGGRRYLRAVFVNPASTVDDVRALVTALIAAAQSAVANTQ